jgi:hypothetical protein
VSKYQNNHRHIRWQNFNNIELQVDFLVVVRGIEGENVGSARGCIILKRIRLLMLLLGRPILGIASIDLRLFPYVLTI